MTTQQVTSPDVAGDDWLIRFTDDAIEFNTEAVAVRSFTEAEIRQCAEVARQAYLDYLDGHRPA